MPIKKPSDNIATGEISYDNVAKLTFEHMTDVQIVGMINSLFDEDYADTAVVEHDKTELANYDDPSKSKGKRAADYNIRVDGNHYHFEFQTDNQNMSLRMLAYGYKFAGLSAETPDSNSVETSFPKQIVVYLRDDEDTATKFTARVKIPNVRDIDGNPIKGDTIVYEVPTLRMRDFEPQELVDKKLTPFVQFSANQFRNITDDDVPRMLLNLQKAVAAIAQANKNGDLTPEQTATQRDSLFTMAAKVVNESRISDKEGVLNTMEQMRDVPTIPNAFVIYDYLEQTKQAKQETAQIKQEITQANQEITQTHRAMAKMAMQNILLAYPKSKPSDLRVDLVKTQTERAGVNIPDEVIRSAIKDYIAEHEREKSERSRSAPALDERDDFDR